MISECQIPVHRILCARAYVQRYCNCKFIMSTGTLLVGDHIWTIIIPMEQLGQIT